ncbi:MAG: Flp family type IVb pilin [Actinomycetes bacterium]|jgi:Flp pilus assembly pilin Flp|nr:Flp family type IVb pilin [Actinomycetes bacterium]
MLKLWVAMQCKWAAIKHDESGQGVVEYVIILAVIAIACVGLAVLFHNKLKTLWDKVTEELGNANINYETISAR